jgi:hypothetical protein
VAIQTDPEEATMSTTHDITEHTSRLELGEEIVADTGAGLRIVELALVVFLGLLICPPLLILAVIVAAPLIAVAAVLAAIALPVFLVRRVRAHHRAHGSTMFLHRLVPDR